MHWFLLLLFVIVLISFLLGRPRSKRPRVPNMSGLNNEDDSKVYDRVSHMPQLKLLRTLIIKDIRKLNTQGILIDLGCGPGHLLIDIHKSFPHLSLIGVDISDAILERAKANMVNAGIAHKVSFRLGDIEKLPFPDNSLDFAISTLSLHHWEKTLVAFGEIHRVLKKGGQFFVFDFRRDSWLAVYFLLRLIQAYFLPKAYTIKGEPTNSFIASYTPSEANNMLGETSFIDWNVRGGIFWLTIIGRK